MQAPQSQASDAAGPLRRLKAGLQRMRQSWDNSLRFRWLILGLAPLLMAFPFVIGVLILVGGQSAQGLLNSTLRGNLAGASSYLELLKTEAGSRVAQLAKTERLLQLLHESRRSSDIDRFLSTTAKGAGLDYLIIARADGTILASSTEVGDGTSLHPSWVVRQAQNGVANAAFERWTPAQLASVSPAFVEQVRVSSNATEHGGRTTLEVDALLINAAAHFPLEVKGNDAILVGGILLNHNLPLIEHMREIIYPVGMLPGEAEGLASIYTEGSSVAVSRQRRLGQRSIGDRAPVDAVQAVMGQGDLWLGEMDVGGQQHVVGFEALEDGEGKRIGLIGVGFPDGTYRDSVRLLLLIVAGLLALTMFGLSVVFLRAGNELTQRLARIVDTMTQVRSGVRDARVGAPLREDEIGLLTRHFDVLLDTIGMQDRMRRQAQQTIADEASRRRALFEHERDGVVILNANGTVFEANPKAASMLGYTSEELRRLRVNDWEPGLGSSDIVGLIEQVGPEGGFFETEHLRKDGSTYPAEVSVSLAKWAERTYVLLLMRDITERRAVESELENYRIGLERLVNQRTKEVEDRSAQVNTIFALSPDGFVSFDPAGTVAFANPAFLRMSGFALGQILGLDEEAFSQALAERCLPQARFPGIHSLRSARIQAEADEKAAMVPGASHEPQRRQLIELAGPGGRVLEVGIRMSHGASVSQVLYFRDVTYEMEVDRMKSEFLSTAAHELRTPMASIYGYSEVLLAEDFDTETRRELLSTIYRQSELMASIINELLDLARIEARRGKDFMIEPVALQELVQSVVADYKVPTGRDAPRLDFAGQPLLVHADRKKIQQAVLNVVSNAYKYSPDGGPVTVRVLGEERHGVPVATIEVQDQGIGMTPEQLVRVCERFFRADTSGKIPGTGLGMSIVKEIVELHGGQVSLTSTYGQGTQVRIQIPLAPAAAPAAQDVPPLPLP